jgi:hypothetical protein
MKINYGDIGIPIKKHVPERMEYPYLLGLLPIRCGIVYRMATPFKSGNDLGLMSPAFTDKEINDLSGKWKL